MTELLDLLTEIASSKPKEPVANSAFCSIRAFLFDAGDVLYHRPERGKKLGAFLNDLSLQITDEHRIQKDVLANQAFTGKITQDQYRENILQLIWRDYLPAHRTRETNPE